MKRTTNRIVLTSAAMLMLAGAASADDKFYIGAAGTGNWSSFGNWSPSGAPQTDDNAILTPADGAARTVIYNIPGGTLINLGSVEVAPAGPGTITLSNVNNRFNAEELILGVRGSFTQPTNASAIVTTTRLSGGTLTSTAGPYAASDVLHSAGQLGAGTFVVGGMYRLDGGSISNAHITSNGTFIHNGGFAAGGTIISNGTLINNNTASLNLHVENRGVMILNDTARFLSLESFRPFILNEGDSLHASTSGFGITISGGTFTQRGTVMADKMRIRGGTWIQESGLLNANSLPGQFLVGDGVDSRYELQGGEAFFADQLKIGMQDANGTVVQSGGLVTALRAPVVGALGGRGDYEMRNGTFNAGGLVLGEAGAIRGLFQQSGGAVSVGTLLLSEDDHAGAELGLSGGTFQVASTTTNNGLIITSGGAATFSGGITGTGGFSVFGGTMTTSRIVQDNVVLYGDGVIKTTAGPADAFSEVGRLVFLEPGLLTAHQGKWDLGEGRLRITDLSETPIESIRAYLAGGYAGGSWNGFGLNSSAAAQAGNTALGYMHDGDAAVVAYTLYGDADLNGAVEIGDFALLAGHFNQVSEWNSGDFDYDGSTTIGDFALLAGNFNRAVTPAALPSARVPEPSGLGAVVAAMGVVRRRRK